ncbi:MAG: DNA mismatch repair protein MutS [Clostridia bacterium]|nr:DNA mismatch repair protein MutS [Clostridia bacterium]MDD4386207.1 DNA mismatch repair protein MutS [Clostridia bacterium]
MTPTPMMQQYLEIKNRYNDSIVFFRLGDFYEMFFDDAITCSRELELTLTGKDCGLEERAPMCGIPYHSVNTYVPKLIGKGYKIAICEQVEDPKFADGLVKRDVVKIVTPGTITEQTLLDDKKNNYVSAFLILKKVAAFAYADISTGEIYISSIFTENIDSKIIDEIARISPSEILISKEDYDSDITFNIKKRFNIYISKYENYNTNEKISELTENMNIHEVQKSCVITILNYIFHTQKNSVNQISDIKKYEIEKHMQLDIQTRRNLEILESSREKIKKGSLLWVLDKTVTAMGGRLLRDWVQNPLLEKTIIEKRQNSIEVFTKEFILKDEITFALKQVYDIERIISKIVGSTAGPKDVVVLKNSIEGLPKLKELIGALSKISNDKYITEIYSKIDTLEDLYKLINISIVDDPPVNLKDGEIIKSGYNFQIDEYRLAKSEGNKWLMELEAEEKYLTNIKSLKVSYNRVFGYYIEVTNSYKDLVPKDRYITKQTLAGCERYITTRLKEIEEKILNAEDKLKDLEYKIFCVIREKVGNEVKRVQLSANLVATLDGLISLATVAIENDYVKPTINTDNSIQIVEGRHPVVEKALKDISFIANDTYLDNEQDMFNIITGPNMAGKSTYMRQVALISYMSQIGSFVPAKEVSICIVDRIFTRVGASDDLSMGESTFMVEMSELSNILKNATNNSLVILDEIGRGTSTYDGLAIAWATVEYIVSEVKCKTLFATHYHELTELEDNLECVKNYSVQTEECGDDVIFLHKIVPGGADNSYGIYVAKLAGLPKKTISRARHILKELELSDIAKKSIKVSKKIDAENIAVDMFNFQLNEISKILKNTDLDELSPREGLQLLYKLKEKSK